MSILKVDSFIFWGTSWSIKTSSKFTWVVFYNVRVTKQNLKIQKIEANSAFDSHLFKTPFKSNFHIWIKIVATWVDSTSLCVISYEESSLLGIPPSEIPNQLRSNWGNRLATSRMFAVALVGANCKCLIKGVQYFSCSVVFYKLYTVV